MSDPKSTLLTRAQQTREEVVAAERTTDVLGNVRLLLVLGAFVLLLLPLVTRDDGPWWALIPLGLAFLVLGKAQDRGHERLRDARARLRYYEDGLSRCAETWRELPDDGADLRPEAPVAEDLDLFGPASLFQLLVRAQTARGRRALATWLVEPASVEEVMLRQEAVRELAPKLDDRARLHAAASAEERALLDDARIKAWAEDPDRLPAEPLLWVVGTTLPVLLASTFVIYQLGGPGLPLGLAVITQLLVIFALGRWVGPRVGVLSGPERTLRRAKRTIAFIEAWSLEAPWLQARRERMAEAGASREIQRLARLVNLLDARLNVVFALTLGPALMWDLNIVLRTERWRRKHGHAIHHWFEAVGDFEALASLAALAYERPDYGFAEFEGEGRFEATQLRHPLIRADKVVANDITLGGPGSVLLLSGSNMSGKSTLLRAVGLSMVLFRAGGPVPANRMVASPMSLETSVRIVDSLARGTSHFYAELERLKSIVDSAGAKGPQVLYLLDEVLHGTNSRERYIGAVAVIRWLSHQGAVGIVTTHDLGLADVGKDLPQGAVTQSHFSDHVEGGEIKFDYILRPGPIASTNALRLMRAVGIDVPMEA